MAIKTDISKIHYSKDNKGWFFNVLKFCSVFYRVGCEFKNFLYDANILQPKKVNAFVVSVGNLTTGGVGKTPYVAELVKKYSKEGKIVAVVSRGYGGTLKGVNVISDGKEVIFNSKEAGDEPYWLGKNTNAIVITSPIRYDGAVLAIEKYGAEVIILDDGFQHRKLKRDLDIVLIDSEKQLGNKKLLPAGPLREEIINIKRADKIVVVSKNIVHYGAENLADILKEKFRKSLEICKIEPDFAYNIFNKKEHLEKSEKVIAFSGIGQPEQFYKFLKDFDVIKTVDFDDHYSYSQKDVEDLENYKLPLVTTEKDAVKLKNLKFNQKVFALKLKVNIQDYD